jgi:2-polyprenyl-3-methyl-5-hydroxy-6-metoxy-1,4-benzoquinol methylase
MTARWGLLESEVRGAPATHYAAALELAPAPNAGARLLELGAGHCEMARLFRERGWRVHTADLEPACVREAAGLGFPSVQVDLNDGLPFADAALDLVVMLEVLEHVLRAEVALAEVARVLRPGGRLLLSTPNHAFYKSRVRMLKGRPLGMEGEHVRFFVKAQLERLLAERGLRLVDRNSSGHLPLMDSRPLRRLLGRPRVLCRIPARLEASCALNFVWLAERAAGPLPRRGVSP